MTRILLIVVIAIIVTTTVTTTAITLGVVAYQQQDQASANFVISPSVSLVTKGTIVCPNSGLQDFDTYIGYNSPWINVENDAFASTSNGRGTMTTEDTNNVLAYSLKTTELVVKNDAFNIYGDLIGSVDSTSRTPICGETEEMNTGFIAIGSCDDNTLVINADNGLRFTADSTDMQMNCNWNTVVNNQFIDP